MAKKKLFLILGLLSLELASSHLKAMESDEANEQKKNKVGKKTLLEKAMDNNIYFCGKLKELKNQQLELERQLVTLSKENWELNKLLLLQKIQEEQTISINAALLQALPEAFNSEACKVEWDLQVQSNPITILNNKYEELKYTLSPKQNNPNTLEEIEVTYCKPTAFEIANFPHNDNEVQ